MSPLDIPTDTPAYRCPWCGMGPWETREGLELHWTHSPACQRNRTVSSPMPVKGGPRIVPGEGQLARVEAHRLRRIKEAEARGWAKEDAADQAAEIKGTPLEDM